MSGIAERSFEFTWQMQLALAQQIMAQGRKISSSGNDDPRLLLYISNFLREFSYPRSPEKLNSFVACRLIFSPIFYIRLSSFKEVFDTNSKYSTERRTWTYTSEKCIRVFSEIADFSMLTDGFSVTIFNPPSKAIEGDLTDISEELPDDQNQERPPVVFIHQDPGKPIGTLEGGLHRNYRPENKLTSFEMHENPDIEGPFIKLGKFFTEEFFIFPDGKIVVPTKDTANGLKEVYVDRMKFNPEQMTHVNWTINSEERVVF